MPYSKYPLLNKKKLKTISIHERKSKVKLQDFARPPIPGADLFSFLQSLPKMQAAADFLSLGQSILKARKIDKPIVWGLGAHVLKVGLNPVLIDLMERGWVSALAVNGALMIHDFEIALAGHTSEDVDNHLLSGTYGNTEETGIFINQALREGAALKMGIGEAVGRFLQQAHLPHQDESLFYNAYRLNIPVTVHPAIGTDFIHFHPTFSGEILGALAERDFLLFASITAKLGGGGVFLNIGSAVILPEVFMKAVACCAAQGIKLPEMTCAVFDFRDHYRPRVNVAGRPVGTGGKGYYFIGHHEIMVPLLAAMILNFPR